MTTSLCIVSSSRRPDKSMQRPRAARRGTIPLMYFAMSSCHPVSEHWETCVKLLIEPTSQALYFHSRLSLSGYG